MQMPDVYVLITRLVLAGILGGLIGAKGPTEAGFRQVALEDRGTRVGIEHPDRMRASCEINLDCMEIQSE